MFVCVCPGSAGDEQRREWLCPTHSTDHQIGVSARLAHSACAFPGGLPSLADSPRRIRGARVELGGRLYKSYQSSSSSPCTTAALPRRGLLAVVSAQKPTKIKNKPQATRPRENGRATYRSAMGQRGRRAASARPKQEAKNNSARASAAHHSARGRVHAPMCGAHCQSARSAGPSAPRSSSPVPSMGKLQSGQTFFFCSHSSAHAEWKVCRHGNVRT